MKVYLAAQYCEKYRLRALAEELESKGIEVTSTWLSEPHGPNTQMHEVTEDDRQRYAITDLEDVDRADCLVFFSIEPTQSFFRGGRHVEFGYAYAKGKEIIVVGPQENIFHHLPQIERKTWPETVYYLEVQSKIQAHVKNLQQGLSETGS